MLSQWLVFSVAVVVAIALPLLLIAADNRRAEREQAALLKRQAERAERMRLGRLMYPNDPARYTECEIF